MRSSMKLKRFFSGRNLGENGEISGSFDGDASDSLLANKKEGSDWDLWSAGKKESERGRGRSSSIRRSIRRSLSERPSLRKRSKSEVSKRLKKLEGDMDMDIGTITKKKTKGSSKSVGGVAKGKSSDVHSKIDRLALKRAESDSRVNRSSSGFDSMFETKPATEKPKKLRGGRRKSTVNDTNPSGTENDTKVTRRSRSASRGRRSRLNEAAGASTRMRSSSRKKRSNSSKPKKSKSVKEFPDILHGFSDDKNSVSTLTTKDSKKKKKTKKTEKEKKKKSKYVNDDSSEVSIPSKVEMNSDCGSQGSITMNDSFQTKKKKVKDKDKDKDKPKKLKRAKSKNNYPALPPEQFGDGLEGLAEEFRRHKGKYDEKSKLSNSKASALTPTAKNSTYTQVSDMFENAWTDMGQDHTGIAQSNERLNPFVDEHGEDDILRQAVDYEVKQSETNEQQEEILKLQQQLSTALQKQLTMSEEHIKEKNEFMNVSRELDRLKVELAESQNENHDIIEDLKERDRIIEEERLRVDNLEEAIDKQLGKEEELMKNFHHSEEEIENLLEEIKKFEQKLENGDTSGGGASFVELRNVKKALLEKEDECVTQKLRIDALENELKDAMTVPQLQIQELDEENKALQGRLKGERLEYTSKLSSKDDLIASLRTELTSYTASPDAQDLQSARQKLTEAREDATTVREDLALTKQYIEKLQGEREDFLEEFTLLKDNNMFMEKTVKELTEKSDNLAKKVLEWTEKTYDWKQRAEDAERKLKEAGGDQEVPAIDAGEDPQGMFLQAAMEKGKKATGGTGRTGSWGIFKNGQVENQELSAEEVRIRVLEEQNLELEAKIAEVSSDLVKMQTGHKSELYSTKKMIAQLEGENEALKLQNLTLEQLRDM